MLKFEHTFEQDPALSDLTVDQNMPDGAIAGVRVDGKAVLLYANAAGFIHLARLFAELGVRDLVDEYHIHFGPDFEDGGCGGDEVELTVMRVSHSLPRNAKASTERTS